MEGETECGKINQRFTITAQVRTYKRKEIQEVEREKSKFNKVSVGLSTDWKEERK